MVGRGAGLPRRWLLLGTHVPASGSAGGMVRYVVELARALADRDDVDLTVLASPAGAPFLADVLGARRVLALPADLPTALRSALERGALVPGLLTASSRRTWDVVHGTKHLLPRRGGARRVLTVHDTLFLDRPQDFPAAKRTLLRRPFLASARAADVCLCVSSATRDRLVHHAPELAARAAVVGLAVAPGLLAAAPVAVPALQGRRFGLVVGDPSPRKNLPFALDVWRRVHQAHPDLQLALAGPPGWGIEDLGDIGARADVVRLGQLSDGQLRWCYEQAEVVLCPSLLEGYGLPAVEAVALGARVVTSEDPALVEVSGPFATHLPLRPDVWSAAVLDLIAAPKPRTPTTARTWRDVAADTVRAVAAT